MPGVCRGYLARECGCGRRSVDPCRFTTRRLRHRNEALGPRVLFPDAFGINDARWPHRSGCFSLLPLCVLGTEYAQFDGARGSFPDGLWNLLQKNRALSSIHIANNARSNKKVYTMSIKTISPPLLRPAWPCRLGGDTWASKALLAVVSWALGAAAVTGGSLAQGAAIGAGANRKLACSPAR